MKKTFPPKFKSISFLILFISVAYILSVKFVRFDLSTDKRFSLSELTIKKLDKINQDIVFNIYLSGDLPLSFKRLEKRIRENFQEFEAYSNKIKFNFIDPYEKFGANKINDLYEDLTKLGIVPTNIKIKTQGGFTQKKIFPGATVKADGKILGINFLVNNKTKTAEQNLNASFEGIEYNIINAIDKITRKSYSKLAFLQDHGELDKFQTADIYKALYETYDISYLSINGDPAALDGIEILIIAGTKEEINSQDRAIIDRFIMEGGKTLWLVDGMHIKLKELMKKPASFGVAKENSVHSMLFNYGVRINYNLIMDRSCINIPINIASKGESPNFVPAPWYFSPLISGSQKHPITKNLNLIKSEFISSIDTVNFNPRLKKTSILTSSSFAKKIQPPVKISMDWINRDIPNEFFNEKELSYAMLMEGKFKSTVFSSFSGAKYSKPTKMIVIADASIIENDVRDNGTDRPQIFPLGYDRFINQTFSNKDFIVNCVNYLSNNSDLLNLRGREIKLRLLNNSKIQDYRGLIITLNLILPIVLIILIGIIFNLLRRRKYRK